VVFVNKATSDKHKLSQNNLAIKQGRRVTRREPHTREKAQDQDNSSMQQTITLGSPPSYASNKSISKSPSKAAIEMVGLSRYAYNAVVDPAISITKIRITTGLAKISTH